MVSTQGSAVPLAIFCQKCENPLGVGQRLNHFMSLQTLSQTFHFKKQIKEASNIIKDLLFMIYQIYIMYMCTMLG